MSASSRRGEESLWNKWVLSLHWKSVGTMDDENGEVTSEKWGESEGDWLAWDWRNESGMEVDYKDGVMHFEISASYV